MLSVLTLALFVLIVKLFHNGYHLKGLNDNRCNLMFWKFSENRFGDINFLTMRW